MGDNVEDVVVDDLTRTQIIQYAGVAGDFNPHHTDEVFATQAAGYPTVFAPGMLTMAMSAKVLTDWLGDGRLLTYGARFNRQVWPGDTLTARAEIVQVDLSGEYPIAELSLVTCNQAGEKVLVASAKARLDPS